MQKSQEAFLLGLELYNKPTISYRAESFSLFFSNAWELMLKAYLFEKSGGKRKSIFKKKQRNKKRQSISLDDSLSRIFVNINDPVRRNVEYISEIRNEAVHLIIQELYPFFSRAFQAGVNNYINYINEWFKIDINEMLNPGLISLISDRDHVSKTNLIKRKYTKEDFKSITEWIDKYNDLQRLGDNAALSIHYKLAIVKNPKKADIVISSGKTGKNAFVIEKTKDPDLTHPYNRKKAIEIIISRISRSLIFNQYDFEAYCFIRGIKKANNDCFYRGRYAGSGQFSEKFLDELVQSISAKSLRQWRKQYKQHTSKKKII